MSSHRDEKAELAREAFRMISMSPMSQSSSSLEVGLALGNGRKLFRIAGGEARPDGCVKSRLAVWKHSTCLREV